MGSNSPSGAAAKDDSLGMSIGGGRTWLALLVVLVASGVVSCADDADDHPGGNVVLYTSIPEGLVDQIEGVIEQRFPDIDGTWWVPIGGESISLTVVRGRTADIEELIAEDIADEGRIRADLIWLAEPSPYERYKDKGLLAPYSPPPDAPIPADYIDPDGYYVAARVMSMVVAWNTDLCPGGLDDWPDLLSADSSAFPVPRSGAARATIKGLLENYGRSYLLGLAVAGAQPVPSNEDAASGVADGKYEAAAVLDYMARQGKASGQPIDYAYPASGTVVIPSPIAITAGAKNPGAAEAVADFIMSQAGQKMVVEIGSFYPARSDVDPPAGAPPLDTITAIGMDWDELEAEIGEITRLWVEAFGRSGTRVS